MNVSTFEWGITLAVTLAGGQLGAAWHDAATQSLRLVTVPGGGGEGPAGPPPALGLLLATVRPAAILAPAASDPALLGGLRAGVEAMAEAGREEEGEAPIF